MGSPSEDGDRNEDGVDIVEGMEGARGEDWKDEQWERVKSVVPLRGSLDAEGSQRNA